MFLVMKRGNLVLFGILLASIIFIYGCEGGTYRPTPPPESREIIVRTDAQVDVAYFNSNGDLKLKGNCNVGNCGNAPLDAYIIKNDNNVVVSYFDNQGNLCLEQGPCSGQSADCSIISEGHIIKDDNGNNMAYISNTGELCLIGNLYENQNI